MYGIHCTCDFSTIGGFFPNKSFEAFTGAYFCHKVANSLPKKNHWMNHSLWAYWLLDWAALYWVPP